MGSMSRSMRIATLVELAAWLAAFAWLFSGVDAVTNLMAGLPVALTLIGVRLAASVVVGACVSVWRGLTGSAPPS